MRAKFINESTSDDWNKYVNDVKEKIKTKYNLSDNIIDNIVRQWQDKIWYNFGDGYSVNYTIKKLKHIIESVKTSE